MGNVSKITYIILFVIWVSITLLVPLSVSPDIRDLISYIMLGVLVLVIIFLIFYSRYINQNIYSIGNIEITRKGIIKSIGGFVNIYHYREINEIHVKKHVRSVLFPLNAEGSKTYIMTIINNDLQNERFIVSSQSTDKPEVNLLATLKKLEKLTGEKIKIKNQ